MKKIKWFLFAISLCAITFSVAGACDLALENAQEKTASDEASSMLEYSLDPKSFPLPSGDAVSLNFLGDTQTVKTEDDSTIIYSASVGDFEYRLSIRKELFDAKRFFELEESNPMADLAFNQWAAELFMRKLSSELSLSFEILKSEDPEVRFAILSRGVLMGEKDESGSDGHVYHTSLYYCTQKGDIVVLDGLMSQAERFKEVADPFDWQPNVNEQTLWEEIASSVRFENLD